MKNKFFIISACFLQIGCAQNAFRSKPNVQLVVKEVYPDLPDIPIPPPVKLLPFSVDMPRDLSRVVPKNTTECLNVPEEERDEKYWQKCGENPIILESNIFVGLTKENWDNLNINLKILQENDYMLRQLLEEANKTRRRWREKNRKKIQKDD